MKRVLACVFVAAAAGAAGPVSAQAPGPVPAAPGGVFATNAAIQQSVERISAGSRSWRQAVDEIRRSGRQVIVATPDQVVVSETLTSRPTSSFDPTVLAEVAYVPEHGVINSVLVVVNLPLLDRLHRSRGSLQAEFDADLDRVVVHEVYGHAIPYLLAGNESGRCADPLAGQRALESCSIQRENVVRGELGLGRRTDYGLGGLFLSRR